MLSLMKRMKIGVIGCGNISSQYLDRCRAFPVLEVAGCADLDVTRARAQAEKFGVPRACGVDELLADGEIELVVNLTVPAVHAEVALRAIESGKHVYGEKPLAVTPAEGRAVLSAAAARGVRVGNAPDTFLGTGHQTVRHVIDSGRIGRPVAAVCLLLCAGHEHWHPDPAFYYKPGGGPMFDMGPYYLTALINLFGPMKRVCGMAGILRPDRTITSKPRFGTPIKVETEDHVAGHIEFTSGAIATIVTTFAARHAAYDGKHPIQVFGTDGTLQVPDPNGFEGTVLLRTTEMAGWEEVAPTHRYPNGRGLGVADMAHAILNGRDHRASGGQAMAVLDAMQGFLTSSHEGRYHDMAVDYHKPAMMPTEASDGVLD
jgi:predicted dehydrogenase